MMLRVSRVTGLGLVLVFALASAGCKTRRSFNSAWNVGGRVVPTDGGEDQAGTVGGLAGTVSLAETQDWVTGWGHADVFLGGNTAGWAGEAELAAEAGGAFFDGEHHLLARAGFAGTIERNPYTGLMLLELPVGTAGYQYHGTGNDDSLHLDLGARGGLAAAGRAFGSNDMDDFAARPQLGGIAVWMWELVAVRFQYDRIFADPGWHLFRSETCFEGFFALCVDTRHLATEFDGAPRVTDFVGISFGFGLASGLEYSSAW